jgi:RecJ-like exonuclease
MSFNDSVEHRNVIVLKSFGGGSKQLTFVTCPELTEESVRDRTNRQYPCPRCNGTGKEDIQVTPESPVEDCCVCDGTGENECQFRKKIQTNNETRKLFSSEFEMMKRILNDLSDRYSYTDVIDFIEGIQDCTYGRALPVPNIVEKTVEISFPR